LLNETTKTGINELKDSENNSEQESFNLSNIKPQSLFNLREKLNQTKEKKVNTFALFNMRNDIINKDKLIKLKERNEENKFNTISSTNKSHVINNNSNLNVAVNNDKKINYNKSADNKEKKIYKLKFIWVHLLSIFIYNRYYKYIIN